MCSTIRTDVLMATTSTTTRTATASLMCGCYTLGQHHAYTSEMVLVLGQSDGRFCDEHNARTKPQ